MSVNGTYSWSPKLPKDYSDYSFLVTGGAGFIGSHIVEHLLNGNAKLVRVIDDLSTGFQSNIDLFKEYPNFEFINGDIRDIEVCRKACKNIDFVSHQAAIGSVPRSIDNPMYTTSVNVGGSVNIFQAAVENKVKRLVFASSSSVYGDDPNLPKIESKTGKPMSPYAVSKMSMEHFADVFHSVHGLEIIGFRYFNIFGPRQSPKGPYAAVIPLFIEGVIDSKPLYINGDGTQTRDFTYVANAVKANVLGMFCSNPEAHNQIFNIATGDGSSVFDLYQRIAKQLESTQKVSFRAPRKGDVLQSQADISKAKKLIGYSPETSFEDGLQKTIKFFQSKLAETKL